MVVVSLDLVHLGWCCRWSSV